MRSLTAETFIRRRVVSGCDDTCTYRTHEVETCAFLKIGTEYGALLQGVDSRGVVMICTKRFGSEITAVLCMLEFCI